MFNALAASEKNFHAALPLRNTKGLTDKMPLALAPFNFINYPYYIFNFPFIS